MRLCRGGAGRCGGEGRCRAETDAEEGQQVWSAAAAGGDPEKLPEAAGGEDLPEQSQVGSSVPAESLKSSHWWF